MAEARIVAKTSYWLEGADAPEYKGRAEPLTLIRSDGEAVIEFAVTPDAHPKKVDTLFIRVPAGELMAALTAVLMGKSPHADDEP